MAFGAHPVSKKICPCCFIIRKFPPRSAFDAVPPRQSDHLGPEESELGFEPRPACARSRAPGRPVERHFGAGGRTKCLTAFVTYDLSSRRATSTSVAVQDRSRRTDERPTLQDPLSPGHLADEDGRAFGPPSPKTACVASR